MTLHEEESAIASVEEEHDTQRVIAILTNPLPLLDNPIYNCDEMWAACCNLSVVATDTMSTLVKPVSEIEKSASHGVVCGMMSSCDVIP